MPAPIMEGFSLCIFTMMQPFLCGWSDIVRSYDINFCASEGGDYFFPPNWYAVFI